MNTTIFGGYKGCSQSHPIQTLNSLIAGSGEVTTYKDILDPKSPPYRENVDHMKQFILSKESDCFLGYSLSCLVFNIALHELRSDEILDPKDPPFQKVIMINPAFAPRTGIYYPKLKKFFSTLTSDIEVDLSDASIEKPICFIATDDIYVNFSEILDLREKMRLDDFSEPISWIYEAPKTGHFNEFSDMNAVNQTINRVIQILSIDMSKATIA